MTLKYQNFNEIDLKQEWLLQHDLKKVPALKKEYSTSCAVLDYETRSKVELKTSGAIVYARDESTSIFCLGYRINHGTRFLWIPERSPMPDDLWNHIQSGGLLAAHNAGFERAISRFTLPRYPLLTPEQKQTLIDLPISQWRCTAAKTAMCHLPRNLEMAAQALGLPTQKDMKGSKLIKKYSKPRRPSKKNPKLWWDDKKDLRGIYRYCLVDVQAEYELDEALPDLSDYEQKVWELDQRINDRGVLIDIPTVKIILKMIREETANITREVVKLSKGTISSVGQHAKLLKWLNDRGAEMTNLQAQTIRDKLEEDGLSHNVRAMLEYRQGGSKTSTAKYISMLKAVGDDDRARELLLYSGTMPTNRWAGKRIQPQNFPRPTIKGFNSDDAIRIIKKGSLDEVRKVFGRTKVMDVLVSSIRGMLIPTPGHVFFCGDFSAVEARVAFWLARHEEGIKAYKEDRKLYEEMAALSFDMDLAWLCTEEGKASLERFVGKESVLGCQYGMGWLKFMKQCHKKGMKSVTEEIAKKAVYAYRKVHWPVPQFWKDIEQACIDAILNPGEEFPASYVTAYVKNDFLIIRLPDGGRLRYYKPRVAQKQLAGGRMVPEIRHWTIDSYTKKWVETVTWGGVLTNHCVQKIARQLMVNAMFNVEAKGYKVVLTVHDELLAEKKKGTGSVKEFISLMTKLPDWAKRCPITAEGWQNERYKK